MDSGQCCSEEEERTMATAVLLIGEDGVEIGRSGGCCCDNDWRAACMLTLLNEH